MSTAPSTLSLKELLETVEYLKAHDIHLVSLEERIDTTSAGGELVFHVFGQSPTSSVDSSPSARATVLRPPLDRETVSAAQTLVEAGLTPGQAAKQLGIGRATAYRIARRRAEAVQPGYVA